MSTATPRSTRRRLLAAVLAVGLLVGLGAVAATMALPRSDAAFDTGPIVVLGGGETHRIGGAGQLPGVGQRPDRLLIASWVKPEDVATIGRSCDEPHVRCVQPEPVSTYGEARMVGQWAAEEGWDQVTVVTSDFHVPRSRWLFERCVDASVSVVGVERDLSPRQRVRAVARESAALLRSMVLHRSCG